MTRRMAALVGGLAALLLLVTAAWAGKTVFEDKFANLDPAWGSPGPIMNVKDGKFVITPEKNTTQTILNQANIIPNDMEASYALTFVQAPAPTWGSGLVFWAKDYDEYYAVLMNAQGWFAVQRHVAGRYLLPVAWREAEVIKKGAGAENQVKVTTKGNQAAVAINGKEVISFNGQPPEGGSLIGFKVASGAEGGNSAGFANLKIIQP